MLFCHKTMLSQSETMLFSATTTLPEISATSLPGAKGCSTTTPQTPPAALLDQQVFRAVESHKVAHGDCHVSGQLLVRGDAGFEVERLEPQQAVLALQFGVEAPHQAVFVQDRQAEVAVDAPWARACRLPGADGSPRRPRRAQQPTTGCRTGSRNVVRRGLISPDAAFSSNSRLSRCTTSVLTPSSVSPCTSTNTPSLINCAMNGRARPSLIML